MNVLVAFFLLAIVLVGTGVTMFVDVPMRFEERLLAGVVLGVVTVSAVGYPVAWAGGMSRASIVSATIMSLGIAGFGWRRDPIRLREELSDLARRSRLGVRDQESVWPVALLTLFSAVVSIRIARLAYGVSDDGGITAGHLSTFGDWSTHLAYAGSFAYGDNFPPELPTAVGERFAYHFGVDWFAAMFVPLGTSLPAGLQISTALLAIAFPGTMYLASWRLVGRRLAAMIGVVVFLASGGTAALYRFLFEDLLDGGISILGDLPRTYAFDGFQRNWVDNAVTGFLYPQRPTMVGFAVVLVGLAWLWQERGSTGHRTLLVVGVVTGLMPVFHVFSFGVLVVMGCWWALLERGRRWWWFVAPALALGVPLVLGQLPENGAAGRRWHLGWILGLTEAWPRTPGNFVAFWLLNTGIFIPLVVLAMVRWRSLAIHWLPIFGLLLIPNVAILHFWEGNNAKYVIYFLLLGAPFVGLVLADWFDRRGFMAFGAALALVSLTLSGSLDIWQAVEGDSGAYPAPYLTGDDVLVGEWIRDHTPVDAVFAASNTSTHPVRAISGRRVVSDFPGRLNDLGVDWVTRDTSLRTIYGVNEGFDAEIARYEIDYVVLGPLERQSFRPQTAPDDWDPAVFWDAAAPIVYDVGGYKVYDVRGYQEATP